MDINEFTSNFRLGGQRTNLFRVEISNPVDGTLNNIIPFRVKSANVPSWQNNEIEVPYMGRKTYVAGVKNLEPWTVTVMEDADLRVRNALEAWSNRINLMKENRRDFPTDLEAEYKSIAKVDVLNKLDVVVREYSLFELWPQNVGTVQLDWSDDNIVMYDVTFRYNYLEITGGTSGLAGKPAAAIQV